MDSIPTGRRVWGVNVLGRLRGSDAALRDEHILVDGHYDGLGYAAEPGSRCRPVGADSICNGADDDAAGIVATLKIAQGIRNGAPPRRTILFAAMTGEEVGLLGARWYADHPALPLTTMVANLEIEMIGRPDSLAGGFGKAWLTGYERSTMGDMLAAAGIPLVPDPRPDQQFFRRSDNYALALQGVVAHTLSSFNLHTDYHQVGDEARKVDPAHMAAVIESGLRAVRLLADGPRAEWKPGGKP
jgi:Zn-dependent M28 family amino/carboxypeptidase